MAEVAGDTTAWWFAFRGSDLLVHSEEGGLRIPAAPSLSPVGLAPLSQHLVGDLDGLPAFAAQLPAEAEPPAGMAFLGLRACLAKLDPEAVRMAGRAMQILEWDRTHKYCGVCGAATALKADESAKQCPACGALFFPRISPAIITLVRDGDRILLARNHRFRPGWFSTIAGFVEAGETLEEAVAREVAEEVGVQVRNLRYFGSQSWPFPNSLMIGFIAEYAGGEIRVQADEIAEARWFTPDDLPDLPAKHTIARQMIDWFLADVEKG